MDRIARLESQLASLMEALAALESRVAELEPKA
jgi:uncharacterized coiled-coil protein SlyX